jgi:hypothetical protein
LAGASKVPLPAGNVAQLTPSRAYGTKTRSPSVAAFLARDNRVVDAVHVRGLVVLGAAIPAEDPLGRVMAAQPVSGTMVTEPVASKPHSRFAGVVALQWGP